MAAPPPKPRQKSSKVVTLTILGVVSIMVVGFCAAQDDPEEVAADCVDMSTQQDDGSYLVLDDSYCDESGGRSHGGGSPFAAYGWYYAGTRVAGRVVRGSTIRPADAKITSRSGHVIQRGGFGGRGSGGS